jgi:molybdate transport system regulatory protein
MSERPLVERSAGGSGGGGTTLTEEGVKFLERFKSIQRARMRFIHQMEAKFQVK